MLLCDADCVDIIQNAFKAIKAPQQPSLNLRYGMETTSLLLCVGNNSSGIRSRHRSYGDASFCYDPVSRKTYFISSPKYGEGLGTVCAGVVMENNTIVVAGEASASKLSRQKDKNIEIYRCVSSNKGVLFSHPYLENVSNCHWWERWGPGRSHRDGGCWQHGAMSIALCSTGRYRLRSQEVGSTQEKALGSSWQDSFGSEPLIWHLLLSRCPSSHPRASWPRMSGSLVNSYASPSGQCPVLLAEHFLQGKTCMSEVFLILQYLFS